MSPPIRTDCALGALAASVALGCGSSQATVGYAEAGGSFIGPDDGDGSTTRLVDIVVGATSSEVCPGQCATLSAAASGGVAPYTYLWDDGVAADAGTARVCPTKTTTYSVAATDSSASTGEFNSQGATGTGDVTVAVSTCTDGSTPIGDGACPSAGEPPPESGHYAGTVSCGPGSVWQNYSGEGDGAPTVVQDGGGGMLGTIDVDLVFDPTTGQPSGTWYFQWDLLVIGGTGSLQASLVCDGSEINATFVNSTWGVPSGNMQVIPAGTLAGSLTAVRTPGIADTISGFFTYTSSVGGNTGDVCVGSYTATLGASDAGAD
jgi:hypothetical protein